ncbi:MAG: hypothetical protein IT458_14040 [Planctomycetes bacterium]|nr:hypothetical protein [Planctomycetota bacterium]
MDAAAPAVQARTGLTVEVEVHVARGHRGRKRLRAGPLPVPADAAPPARPVPRIARLMAMAITMQDLVDRGVVRDYAALARLAGVTRARITQVMALVNLAPGIQEEVLLRSRSLEEREVRRVAALSRFELQRAAWRGLLAEPSRAAPRCCS